MKKTLFPTLALLLLCTGCISMEYSGEKLPPRPETEKVFVYSDSAAVKKPYSVLGTATVSGVTVKNGCIINIGALIDHDCYIEAGVHLCPGVIVKAENRIAAGRKVESGEVIQCRTYPL